MSPDTVPSSTPAEQPAPGTPKTANGKSKTPAPAVGEPSIGDAPASNVSSDVSGSAPTSTPFDIRAPIAIGEEPLQIKTEPWNQERERDQTRSIVAGALILLLIAIVILPFVLLAIKAIDIVALDTLLKIVFAPVVGLVGSVIGFYFGSQSSRKEPGGGG